MQDTQLSPADLIQRLQTSTATPSELLLLTGDSGAGKTTWCLELVRRARAAGLEAAGLVSPAVFEGGVKIGIDLLDLTSGERRRLAARREASSLPASFHPGLAKMNWILDPQVIAWGNQVLASRLPGPLLILDELGPLELLADDGLAYGLKLVAEQSSRVTCVVVRPALLQTALDRWHWAKVMWVASQPEETDLP